jgi:hypothetical protein
MRQKGGQAHRYRLLHRWRPHGVVVDHVRVETCSHEVGNEKDGNWCEQCPKCICGNSFTAADIIVGVMDRKTQPHVFSFSVSAIGAPVMVIKVSDDFA